MKRSGSGKMICLVILMVACTTGAWAMDAGDAPEAVSLEALQKLYEPVHFDHAMHADAFACSACHHHTTGGGSKEPACMKCHARSEEAVDVACSGCHLAEGPMAGFATEEKADGRYHIDRPGLKGALHLQCLGCHQAEGGPVGCEECHALTPAGMKRFARQR